MEEAAGRIERLTESDNLCGACYDCLAKARTRAAPDDVMLHVYSFEPTPRTAALVRHAVEHFFPPANGTRLQPPSARSFGTWTVTQAAVGDHDGSISWTADCVGEECAMDKASSQMVDIPLLTVGA